MILPAPGIRNDIPVDGDTVTLMTLIVLGSRNQRKIRSRFLTHFKRDKMKLNFTPDDRETLDADNTIAHVRT
jgi:hypothetical protein